MRQQLRLPGFQKGQPGGGEVETGRGKKAKKAGWHLTLGVRGHHLRRDRLGGFDDDEFRPGSPGRPGRYLPGRFLLGSDDPRMGPKWPSGCRRTGTPATAPTGTPGTATTASVAPAVAPPPAAAPAPPAPVAAKPARPAPVTGSIAPLPPPAAAKKKGKAGATHHDSKSREEEMRQVRQEVAQKLKFQNSFDTGLKPRLPKAKDHEKAPAHPGAGSRVSDQQGCSGQADGIAEKRGQGDPQKNQRLQRGHVYRL